MIAARISIRFSLARGVQWVQPLYRLTSKVKKFGPKKLGPMCEAPGHLGQFLHGSPFIFDLMGIKLAESLGETPQIGIPCYLQGVCGRQFPMRCLGRGRDADLEGSAHRTRHLAKNLLQTQPGSSYWSPLSLTAKKQQPPCKLTQRQCFYSPPKSKPKAPT